MTEHEIRTIIAETLEYANVIISCDNDLILMFLNERNDIPFDQLDMDSLAMMELCIAIETNIGVSIVPDDLQKIGSLNQLVKAVHSEQ